MFGRAVHSAASSHSSRQKHYATNLCQPFCLCGDAIDCCLYNNLSGHDCCGSVLYDREPDKNGFFALETQLSIFVSARSCLHKLLPTASSRPSCPNCCNLWQLAQHLWPY